MERKKNNEDPPKILDFKFEDNDELEEDYESQIAAKIKTLQPMRYSFRRRSKGSDDLESIATVEEVDIKFPSASTTQQMRTLQPKSSRIQNRYLSI